MSTTINFDFGGSLTFRDPRGDADAKVFGGAVGGGMKTQSYMNHRIQQLGRYRPRTRKMHRRIAKLERTDMYYRTPQVRADVRDWQRSTIEKSRQEMIEKHGSLERAMYHWMDEPVQRAPAPISPRPGRWPGAEPFKCVR